MEWRDGEGENTLVALSGIQLALYHIPIPPSHLPSNCLQLCSLNLQPERHEKIVCKTTVFKKSLPHIETRKEIKKFKNEKIITVPLQKVEPNILNGTVMLFLGIKEGETYWPRECLVR